MMEFIVVRAAQLGMIAASIMSAIPDASVDDSLVAWTIRGVTTLGLAAIAYLLNDTMKTIKETKRVQHEHSTKLALHDIMFEQWLDELADTTETPDNPGRRRSDQIIRAIVHETREHAVPRKGK